MNDEDIKEVKEDVKDIVTLINDLIAYIEEIDEDGENNYLGAVVDILEDIPYQLEYAGRDIGKEIEEMQKGKQS